MSTKKEREEMRKALSKINNKWEMIAYIWTYRRKEFLFYLNFLQSAVILYFVLSYTNLIKYIGSLFSGGN